MNRRTALAAAIRTLLGAIAGASAVLLGGPIVLPGLARRREEWHPAATLDELKVGVPTAVALRILREDGYRQGVDRPSVLVTRRDDDSVQALSATCTHLGCLVSWRAADRQFHCPCHGGVYDAGGRVIAGPPRAPLQPLRARVDAGRIFIQI